MKYKVNDIVEVVEMSNGAPDVTLGEKGTVITRDTRSGDYKVKLGGGSCWWYRDEELELAAPTESNSYKFTVIYSHEKILSSDTQVSHLHTTLLPGEPKLDMIKRERLENVHFVFNGHLEPITVSELVSV